METGKNLKHGDALIAAAAIINNATLYSNNDKDFKFIQENFKLKYINPVDEGQFKEFKKSLI